MIRNEKGFTLIEVMAVIIILGVLMLIAVPNTTTMLEKNKKEAMVEDAKKLISLGEYQVQKDKRVELPETASEATIITLKYMNTNDLDKTNYSTTYNKDRSFVAIKRVGDKYVYYAHLVSCNNDLCNDKKYGINLATDADLRRDDRFDLVKSGTELMDFLVTPGPNGIYNIDSILTSSSGPLKVTSIKGIY